MIFQVIYGNRFDNRFSLVNSIFVEAMLSDNTDDISQKIDKLEEKLDNYMKND